MHSSSPATGEKHRTEKERVGKIAQAHAEIFKKQIIEIAEGIYVAVGYAAANVAMLVGQDGLLIIDTTETTSAARTILKEFRRISDLPVDTIIYTHSHRDHISGASVFAEGGRPRIIASHGFASDLVDTRRGDTRRGDTRRGDTGNAQRGNVQPTPTKAILKRTKRQFGMGLKPPYTAIHIGVGPADRPLQGMGEGYLPPTEHLAPGRHNLQICGYDLLIFDAPGETADHLNIWLEDRKILFCGDNFYHSFPNLYAIRGTMYRDFSDWRNTLETLIGLNAETMIPGHTLPVRGKEPIKTRLSDYRDAIDEVLQQTIDGLAHGLSFAEIADRARLPQHLAQKPWLVEHYGRFKDAVRACCCGLIGWFDGNPTHLLHVSERRQAERLAALAGGADALFEKTAELEARGEYAGGDDAAVMAWIAALYALAYPKKEALAAMRVRVLRRMAETEFNAPVRNYFLLSAQEIEDGGWV